MSRKIFETPNFREDALELLQSVLFDDLAVLSGEADAYFESLAELVEVLKEAKKSQHGK